MEVGGPAVVSPEHAWVDWEAPSETSRFHVKHCRHCNLVVRFIPAGDAQLQRQHLVERTWVKGRLPRCKARPPAEKKPLTEAQKMAFKVPINVK